MSLEAEMSTDIVTVTPLINFSDRWSKVAQERIRLKADDMRSPGTPMHLILSDAKADIRGKVCAQLSILDLRRWSGNGFYSHRSGSKVYRGRLTYLRLFDLSSKF